MSVAVHPSNAVGLPTSRTSWAFWHKVVSSLSFKSLAGSRQKTTGETVGWLTRELLLFSPAHYGGQRCELRAIESMSAKSFRYCALSCIGPREWFKLKLHRIYGQYTPFVVSWRAPKWCLLPTSISRWSPPGLTVCTQGFVWSVLSELAHSNKPRTAAKRANKRNQEVSNTKHRHSGGYTCWIGRQIAGCRSNR